MFIPTFVNVVFTANAVGARRFTAMRTTARWMLACLVCLLSVASASAQTRFDYHSIRGRYPLAATTGRLEGETDFDEVGRARPQQMQNFGNLWSGDSHLLWDGAVGDSFRTSFEVNSAGIYNISLQLTTAPDYGTFEVLIGETGLHQSLDTYSPSIGLASLITFTNVRLAAGVSRIEFKLTGSNVNATPFRKKRFLLGLDYVELKRIDAPPEATSDSSLGSTSASDVLGQVESVKAEPYPADEFVAAMKEHCFRCHGGDATEGKLDVTLLKDREFLTSRIEDTRRIRDALARREMPPADEPQPTDNSRGRMLATLDAALHDYLREHHSNAPVVMRRLNRYEYNNAVRDLLQLRGDVYPLPEKTIRADGRYFNPASGRLPHAVLVSNRTLGKEQIERQILSGVSPFAMDLPAEAGFNNRGNQLSVSPILMESFLTLGRSIVDSPEFDGYCKITDSFFAAPQNAAVEQQQSLARERLKPFLETAFRSPSNAATLNRYHDYFRQRLNATKSFTESMKDVVAAMLASPRFIYISESSSNDPDGQLNAFELATRLSFFLWSTLPDETLLASARDGSLLNPEVLDAQTRRMLEDPRSQALAQNFARQWLRLDQLVTAVPDIERFPQFYSRIGCEQWGFGLQMMIEPLLLFESIMVEDRSIMLLIDSNYSYRSDELEAWYGDTLPFADRENRNRFNTQQQRFHKHLLTDRREGGVLTSAAVLTMTSSPLRTSPIARGAWVATVIFNQPPPPPPDMIPSIEADDRAIEAQGLTLRERLKQHQVNVACVACHAKIDPLGFALENYDAVGRWRDGYGSGLEIDATGELFGTMPFKNIVELKDQLLEHPELFFQAFSEHMLSYAIARKLELEDSPVVDEIIAKVSADHGQFSTVVRAIVQSHLFRYQSGESADATELDDAKDGK